MVTNYQIKDVLIQIANEEYTLAGEDAVDKIISANLSGKKIDFATIAGGDNFDFVAILSMVGGIVTLIKNLLDLSEKGKLLLGSKAASDKIDELVADNKLDLDPEVLKKLKDYFRKK